MDVMRLKGACLGGAHPREPTGYAVRSSDYAKVRCAQQAACRLHVPARVPPVLNGAGSGVILNA